MIEWSGYRRFHQRSNEKRKLGGKERLPAVGFSRDMGENQKAGGSNELSNQG
jgi:hypothetical protein